MSPKETKTPFAQKLGLEENDRVLLYNVPAYYGDLLGDLPVKLNFLESISHETADFVHIFCTTQKELEKNINKYYPALRKHGIFWVSWPKMSSNLESEINRDDIRDFMLEHTDLVDVKVAAIDDNWSGLKFVYRLENR